jgi:tetratricopeptide (TPR) repeat protein
VLVLILGAAAAGAGTARAADPAVRSCGNGDALVEIRLEACSALIAAGETVGRPTGWALIQRGFAFGEAGDLERARADFEAALRLAPDQPDAHVGRGLVLWAAGEPAAALPDLDAALALWPDDAQAFNARGLAHAALGQIDQAIADYDAALQLAPTYVAALIHRGQAHAAGGAWRQAIADYQAALALLRGDADSETDRDVARDGIADALQGLQAEANALRRQPGGAALVTGDVTGDAARDAGAVATDRAPLPPRLAEGAPADAGSGRGDPPALERETSQSGASIRGMAEADRDGTGPVRASGTNAAAERPPARADASTVRLLSTIRSSPAAGPADAAAAVGHPSGVNEAQAR